VARQILRIVLVIVIISLAPSAMHAQAEPTATVRASLEAGGGVVSANSDYAAARYKGIFGYADLDLRQHLGGEFAIHQIYSPNHDQVNERTYELGLRYHRSYGRLTPYAKVMAGRGVFNFAQSLGNLAYNLASAGAGADLRITRHASLRVDYEYQHWFSFQSSTLSPSLLGAGAAYRF
jgi:hypothetical protein